LGVYPILRCFKKSQFLDRERGFGVPALKKSMVDPTKEAF
jgi:hypothetical protein